MFGKGLLVFVLLLLPIHALSRPGVFEGALPTVPEAAASRASLGDVDRRQYNFPLHRQLLQVEPENGAEDTKPKLSNSSSNGSTSPSASSGPGSSVELPSAVQLQESQFTDSIIVPITTLPGSGCSGRGTFEGAQSNNDLLIETPTVTSLPGSVVVVGPPEQNDCGDLVAESDDDDD